MRACGVCFVGLASLALACGAPVPPLDAALDDTAVSDDVGAPDGGCTAQPGELPGTRTVETRGLLPNLTFATASGSVALVDYHVPCAPRAELIVIRSVAAWSGHSDWHVRHTGRLLAHPERARVHFVDVLVAGPDALPARVEDLSGFAARYDAPVDALAIDPDETFGALAIAGRRHPTVVLIDARTLRLERILFAPHAGEVEHAIDTTLASLDLLPPPGPVPHTLVDGRFTEDEWDLVLGMAYPSASALPGDASNAVADDAQAVALGAALFADPGLSPAGVSCATCHQEALGFADGLAVGHGIDDVTRNTPTLYAAAFARWPFWDGRVDSLWAQALGPVENAREMGSSRLFVAHAVASGHRAAYEATFGAMPDVSDTARFPLAGMPGDPTWEAMSAADRDLVTRIFTNAGKAIEAYERTLAPPHTRFDDYVAGDTSALTSAERDGLHEYVLEGCADCHWGPAMSDSAFHAIGMPGTGTGASLDVGRAAVLDTLAGSPFRRQGAYSDAPSTPDPLAGIAAFDDAMIGAFRTPTLRGLVHTAPYGHGGTFASVHDVVEHYARIRLAHPPDPAVAGGIDPHLVGFDDVPGRVDPLTAFLQTL